MIRLCTASQFRNRLKALEVAGRQGLPGLDLNGHQFLAPLDEEIRLGASLGRGPVEQAVVLKSHAGTGLSICLEHRGHPAFQQRPTFEATGRVEFPPHGPDYTGIDPVELGVLAFLDPQPAFVGRQEPRQEGVRQDVQVPRHRGPGHAGVTRQARQVQHLSVKQGGDGQETSETRQVAYRASAWISCLRYICT